MTSRAVVDHLQRAAGGIKAGHAGTLDPLASGVLVLCVSKATRLISYVQRMPKQYRATFLLGRRSPTEDIEAEVTLLDNPPVPTREQLCEAARRLVGWVRQRPPAFSALKVAGRRAYDLARSGKPVDLKPRLVEIKALEIEAYDYPELRVRIECGSGTYVRSVGRDMAICLGTDAVMCQLERTSVGAFRVEDAVFLEQLTRETWVEHLLPPLSAVSSLPRVELTGDEVARVRKGQPIDNRTPFAEPRELAAVDSAGRLVAILSHRGGGRLGPTLNLLEDG